MKEYPKILDSSGIPFGQEFFAFDKLDGSNLRFEYSFKKGWYKFGTRHQLFDKDSPIFGESIEIFKEKYSEGLNKVFRDKYKKVESFIAYAEFFGKYSFAGQHEDEWLKNHNLLPEGQTNKEKDIVLFDINVYKKGFIAPNDFIDLFSDLHIPNLIAKGKIDNKFVQDVKDGKYPVIEGVVCKGGNSHKLWMKKIKTNAFIEKLKLIFGSRWEEFGE